MLRITLYGLRSGSNKNGNHKATAFVGRKLGGCLVRGKLLKHTCKRKSLTDFHFDQLHSERANMTETSTVATSSTAQTQPQSVVEVVRTAMLSAEAEKIASTTRLINSIYGYLQ